MMRQMAGIMMGAAALALAAPGQAQNRRQPAGPATIGFGQTLQGEIAGPGNGQCAAPDPRIRAYRFTADAGTRVEVTMQADDFDTLVEIGRMDGCTYTMLASNDDGAGEEDGLNSRLVATLREAGSYVIHAKALAEDGAGRFSVSLKRLPPPPPPPAPVALTLGQEVSGTLGIDDPTIPSDYATDISESGRPYRLYTLAGRAGQEILIKLDSEEFDPFVEAGAMSALGYSVSASNDDGGGEEDGLNSRLRITYQTDGEVVIRVSPLGNDGGAYKLSADIAPPMEEGEAASGSMPPPIVTVPSPRD